MNCVLASTVTEFRIPHHMWWWCNLGSLDGTLVYSLKRIDLKIRPVQFFYFVEMIFMFAFKNSRMNGNAQSFTKRFLRYRPISCSSFEVN